MKRLKLIVGSVAVALAAAFAPAASAETGHNPQLDQLCMNPAFVNATHGVGLAGRNEYCGSNAFVHPKDYGSGPEDELPVVGP